MAPGANGFATMNNSTLNRSIAPGANGFAIMNNICFDVINHLTCVASEIESVG